jgi:hypothetical protein
LSGAFSRRGGLGWIWELIVSLSEVYCEQYDAVEEGRSYFINNSLFNTGFAAELHSPNVK